MNIQDIATKVQNSFSVPFRGDGVSCVLDKNYKATGNEAKPCVDLHGKGIVDSALVRILENDPVCMNTSLPLKSTLQGIISSLNLNSLLYILLEIVVSDLINWILWLLYL